MMLRNRLRKLKTSLALEAKIRDLKVDSRFQTKWRARNQNLNPKYLRTDKNGVVYFQTNSGTHGPVQKWHQRIELLDLKEAIELQKKDPTMTNRDVVNLAVFGDIKVYCDDLSFKYYGWQYITWNLDAGIEPETRPPVRRNPHLEGNVCKHLYIVLDVLPFYLSEITRDLVKAGVLKSKRKGKATDNEQDDS